MGVTLVAAIHFLGVEQALLLSLRSVHPRCVKYGVALCSQRVDHRNIVVDDNLDTAASCQSAKNFGLVEAGGSTIVIGSHHESPRW